MLALAAASALAACGPHAPDGGDVERDDRYGILLDLVFFPRPATQGGPFFLDRFESTQRDWLRYLAAEGAAAERWSAFDAWNDRDDRNLPVVGIDLREAMAFASWRFGRLPRLDEWKYAATAGGRYRLPWGDSDRTAWANSQELGLNRFTPVGTFESGRQSQGPYDLIGNAAEWTLTDRPSWAVWTPSPWAIEVWPPTATEFGQRLAAVRRHPALRPWLRGFVPVTRFLLTGLSTGSLPRVCVGGFDRPMSSAHLGKTHFWLGAPQERTRAPRERSSIVGVRVGADPDTLVEAFLSEARRPTSAEERALRQFLSRPEHRAVLREALLRRGGGRAEGGPLAEVLIAELTP